MEKEGVTEKKSGAEIKQKNISMEKVLVENFVSLQKVMTNLALKFDNLSSQISKLLELFEISAKTMAEKGFDENDKKVMDKLDSLIEQNKIIAKGITLLHEGGMEQQMQMPAQMQPSTMQMQQMPIPPSYPMRTQDVSKNPKFRSMSM